MILWCSSLAYQCLWVCRGVRFEYSNLEKPPSHNKAMDQSHEPNASILLAELFLDTCHSLNGCSRRLYEYQIVIIRYSVNIKLLWTQEVDGILTNWGVLLVKAIYDGALRWEWVIGNWIPYIQWMRMEIVEISGFTLLDLLDRMPEKSKHEQKH